MTNDPGLAKDLCLQLRDYRLTTAEILYRMPDHPQLLQSYIWQEYDLAPDFPTLKRFLAFWDANLEGKLYAVQVANVPIIRPAETLYADALYRLH